MKLSTRIVLIGAKRARTVIMYGVAESGEHADKDYVLHLLHTELTTTRVTVMPSFGKTFTGQSRPLLLTLLQQRTVHGWWLMVGRLAVRRDSWIPRTFTLIRICRRSNNVKLSRTVQSTDNCGTDLVLVTIRLLSTLVCNLICSFARLH